MKYQPIPELDREYIQERLTSGSEDDVIRAVLSAALHDDDWAWAQSICLSQLDHPSRWVKQASITGLGHVVRLHGKLDLDVVAAKLAAYRESDEMNGSIEDLFGDINIFHRKQDRAN
ncbi:hypothetical protein M2281_001800 [Mesorhizobium soli]|jgi:hypothetical protein|uniref:hypothetical protein n=1 Tax=Pseudaminobacter soli (ex Li et al. 2025) TaxID=1295366 RepID=UPI00247665C1|nr:hypothetical protein [Mesorhizobium soli]MDH6231228.1 hypothetical protein [Mesorhizobium soli]